MPLNPCDVSAQPQIRQGRTPDLRRDLVTWDQEGSALLASLLFSLPKRCARLCMPPLAYDRSECPTIHALLCSECRACYAARPTRTVLIATEPACRPFAIPACLRASARSQPPTAHLQYNASQSGSLLTPLYSKRGVTAKYSRLASSECTSHSH